jgi:hypothetical protein
MNNQQVFTLTGLNSKVNTELKKYKYEFSKVVTELYNTIYWHSEFDNYVVLVITCTPYTMEEQQETSLYGSSEHESYLRSDDYESDCKSEQWDWIKNESN